MKTLDLYITKVCNLNCEYCYVDLVKDEQSFEYNSFSERINLLEYDHIKFFGGEPLMKWNDIKNIVNSVKTRKKKIRFTIVTNGLLLDSKKLNYCLEKSVEVVVSMHHKGIRQTILKSKNFLKYNNILGFSFIFELDKLKFPYKVIKLLLEMGFVNFILAPEVYSNWNEKNVKLLDKELDMLFKLFINNNINFKGIDSNELKIIKKGCEKTIMGKQGDKFLCNRFKDLEKLKVFNYKYIYNKFDTTIDFQNDKNKWFYICPIGWFLDSLHREENINERIVQFKSLNLAFIDFYKKINNVKGKLNFLSDNIDEIRFNLTSQCNIRCKYCYIDFKNNILDEKKAKNIIDFFIFQDGAEKIISFFGGEPLLEFYLLKKLVEYAKKVGKQKGKKISFTIATNFLLINKEKVKYLDENNFDIHISLNGTKDVNNKMRDSSTDLLLMQLEQYVDIIGKDKITVLLAFSNIEVGGLYKNIEYIYNLGFKNINLEIIFGKKYLWTRKDIIILKKELLRIRNSLFYKNISLINIKNNRKFLDISVDGKVGENSFEFNNYNVNFKIKEIFDFLIYQTFKN